MSIVGAAAPLPVVVLGGYLGAGKTTLVNELLRQADGERIAVLVNDFGDIAIDADLIEGASGEVLALAGGCVCCSFGADLVGTAQRLLQREPPPQRVLVECSGVGLPAAVARTLRLLPQLAAPGVVTVLDAASVRERAADAYVGDTVRQQIIDAQALVLNKADRSDAAALGALHGWLAEVAPGMPVIEATRAQLPADWVWHPRSTGAAVSAAMVPTFAALRPIGAPGNAAAAASAGTRFRSECRLLPPAVDPPQLARDIVAEGAALQRAKGWLTDNAGTRWLLQAVAGEVELQALPPGRGPAGPDRLLLIRALGSAGSAIGQNPVARGPAPPPRASPPHHPSAPAPPAPRQP
jgi:G3E family GTPase